MSKPKIARAVKRVNRSTSNDTKANAEASRIETPVEACVYGANFDDRLASELERMRVAVGAYAELAMLDEAEPNEEHRFVAALTASIQRIQNERVGNRYECCRTGRPVHYVPIPGVTPIAVEVLLATIAKLDQQLAAAGVSP